MKFPVNLAQFSIVTAPNADGGMVLRLKFGRLAVILMSETNFNSGPLHTLNPLGRFSDRAADYVKYRPTYPAAAIDIIVAGLGEAAVVADIGAGTGISARLLADRGLRVVAIEPNAAMRTAAVSHPFVDFRDGKAEATQLETGSVDLVTCFQAFHWFDPEPTLREFKRVLKPASVPGNVSQVALVWNNRDQEDAFTNAYSRLTIAVATTPVVHERAASARPLLASADFTNVQEYRFANRQALDLAGLIGRVRSNSYTPHEGVALQQLISDLEQLHDRFQDEQGLVYLCYSTSVHLAELTNWR
jgi:SAM-dependent methyltransferase